MTIQELLDTCRANFANVEIAYVHPTLYVFCLSDDFARRDEDYQIEYFLGKCGVSEESFNRLVATATISLCLLSEAERKSRYAFVDSTPGSQHWLPFLDGETRDKLPPAPLGPLPALHFYGYKGGQARTTVLAMLAKSLAEDGYRILIVDADTEAPSLDFLFETSSPNVESTLMGLSGWAEEISPLAAYASPQSNGIIEIIPCRPRSSQYDMDFAAFALRVGLDVSMLRNALEKLKKFVMNPDSTAKYDLVIFDHRTGIASSVLPIIRNWGGPTVVSVRPDGLSEQAMGAFETLFSQFPENPGAYVCFSIDNDDTEEKIFDRRGAHIHSLLEQVAKGLARGAEEDTPLPIEDLYRYWIGWYYDKQFIGTISPDITKLNVANQSSIRQLREVLSLSKAAMGPSIGAKLNDERSPSGATDSGWFIETSDIAKLFSPSSPVNYIIGRKGTGKTRLYREMVARKIAEPLFAAADFEQGGMRSQSVAYSQLIVACENDYGRFWWALLGLGLSMPVTIDDEGLNSAVASFAALQVEVRRERSTSHYVASQLSTISKERIFLIDGIETAVPAAKLRTFIEELLIFMLTLQSDANFRTKLQARLFLRSDLLNNASQNVEQQTSQRIVELRWDSDSIFNYVLAKIYSMRWYTEKFPNTCAKIEQNLNVIRAGRLNANVYEEILLEIFPQKLRRSNLQTLTFFETYFSDASGKFDYGSSFYPRLFETFLVEIASISRELEDKGEPTLENGRVIHTIVLDAHAKASSHFVNEVKQELYVLLDLSLDDAENRRLVDALIAALEGKATPFIQEALIRDLELLSIGIDSVKLRSVLQLMTEVGIFEKHPKFVGQLRAGRLYKSALRMKYVR
jgi:hypothetical protein